MFIAMNGKLPPINILFPIPGLFVIVAQFLHISVIYVEIARKEGLLDLHFGILFSAEKGTK